MSGGDILERISGMRRRAGAKTDRRISDPAGRTRRPECRQIHLGLDQKSPAIWGSIEERGICQDAHICFARRCFTEMIKDKARDSKLAGEFGNLASWERLSFLGPVNYDFVETARNAGSNLSSDDDAEIILKIELKSGDAETVGEYL
jgi:hypothetical protein